MTASRHPLRLLTIAGSDPSGGAGIQADLKTFGALGGYGMSVVAALTAQNTKGVTGIHDVPAAFVEEQLQDVLEDIGADAVKIGMLHTRAVIEAVARQLEKFGVRRVVLDPVMVAKGGQKLLRDDAIEAIKTRLFPLALVATPNLPEAEVLAGFAVSSGADIARAAAAIHALGAKAVIVKGGHAVDRAASDDFLSVCGENGKNAAIWLRASRVATLNTHGTGCTFSSALAVFLGRGLAIETAAAEAKKYVSGAIASAKDWNLGHGHGPVDHFFEER
jgi:hydroxymethylpyrimidine/phosphomethylpyrimidine kinase